ncbi:hypothetical protein XA68_14187 [Ophiocordyceps unilateralis]|uniref:HIT-type domain-containing protein n=1 Tax=Ophiocordyceps unilateralis TaxID=268505 RepID=A0A2A9P993_OPHUN|nr:hypothetical protein XA68_14187 [Ophiocordyceps unilateralis]
MTSPVMPMKEELDAPAKEEPSSLPLSPSGHEADQPAPQRDGMELAPSEGDDAAPTPKGPAMCGICVAVASKYKCSRCYLPYCSVACNKTHQTNHPPDPTPEPSPKPRPSDSPAEPTGPPNPFQALDKSEKLEWLFRKYPNLPQQLLDIHTETQPPPEDLSVRIPASLMRGVPAQGNWSHEKGISRGKAALRRARQLPGEAGEAVREYCTLIMLLLDGEEAENGAQTVLQQQLAQQDADLIRQLMEVDKDRP